MLKNKENGINEKKKKKKMNNTIYILYFFRGHEKDLFHLNNMILYVSYIYNFCYSKRF